MSDIEKNEHKAEEEKAETSGAAKENVNAAQDDKKTKKNNEGKNGNLEKKMEAALAERDEYKDKYLRTLAEFNNYKKRMQTACSESLREGQCVAVEQILPVLDNLERALEHIEEDEDSPMAKGLTMVHKLLVETIQKLGIKEIPAMGEPFDPTRHQAIQTVEAGEGETPGNVGAVVQKGYMADDRIIRHSMVIVNK